MWFEHPDIAHRLSHPFVHPGGPSAVVEEASARRQRVGEFQRQAEATWSQLTAIVGTGLNEQARLEQQSDVQQQQQQQQPGEQQQDSLDVSGLAEPLLPRRRLTGPVMLVPRPEQIPPGMTAEQATAAAVAAMLASQQPTQPLATLVVPAGCLQLHSWQESASAVETPGEVASGPISTPTAAAAAGRAGIHADGVMQPGSEVVLSLVVFENTSGKKTRLQEIQALGSNTLSQLKDSIRCPTDKLAAGLGASNPAAYFYIDNRFYDDTRAAPASECSAVVERWALQLGLAGPRRLHRHFEPIEGTEDPSMEPQPSPAAVAAGGSGNGLLASLLLQQQGGSQQLGSDQQQQQRAGGGGGRRDMQHVRLSDLVLQASNRPMVLYCHQGLCEHAVMVADVRLLHAADPQHRSSYPRTVFQAALSRRFHCGLCKRLGATALMLDHPETPEAVTMLCRLCVQLFDTDQYPAAKLIMLEEFKSR